LKENELQNAEKVWNSSPEIWSRALEGCVTDTPQNDSRTIKLTFEQMGFGTPEAIFRA